MKLHVMLLLTMALGVGIVLRLFSLQSGIDHHDTLHRDINSLRRSTHALESKIERLALAVDRTSLLAERRRRRLPGLTHTTHADGDSGTKSSGDISHSRHAIDAAAMEATLQVRPQRWEGVLHSGDDSSRCEPSPVSNVTRPIDYIVLPQEPFPANCEGRTDVKGVPELCNALRKVAVRREVLVVVCDSNVQNQLEVFVQATRKASITNLLVIALDVRMAEWCSAHRIAAWLREDSAKGSHKISAQKFKFIGTILSVRPFPPPPPTLHNSHPKSACTFYQLSRFGNC